MPSCRLESLTPERVDDLTPCATWLVVRQVSCQLISASVHVTNFLVLSDFRSQRRCMPCMLVRINRLR